MPDIHPAGPGEFPARCRSLARAFQEDPGFAWLFPNEATRPRRSLPLWEATLRMHVRHGSLITTVDGGVATAVWDRPDDWRIPTRALVADLPRYMRSLRTGLPRALRGLSALERRHPAEPHWYLAILGTDPDHQRRGLASSLLRPVLDRCDTDGLPAYLETGTPQNVAFYYRHGFVVREEMDLPGRDGPHIWFMWREPKTD